MEFGLAKLIQMLFTAWVVLALSGCATNIPGNKKGLLGFLEDGKTAKETALTTLGLPSGTSEKERIIVCRLAKDARQGLNVMDRFGGFSRSVLSSPSSLPFHAPILDPLFSERPALSLRFSATSKFC